MVLPGNTLTQFIHNNTLALPRAKSLTTTAQYTLTIQKSTKGQTKCVALVSEAGRKYEKRWVDINTIDESKDNNWTCYTE